MDKLAKEQRLDGYVFAYFCLIAGFNEEGLDIYGFHKQYICDYLWEWRKNKFNTTTGNLADLFPEWYSQEPDIIPPLYAPAWWPQKSPKRIKALVKAIAACENSKQ